MKHCPRCNHEVQEKQMECPNCGVVFAKWYASHPSSSTPVSLPVRATGKFTPRHQKYLGLVLVILGSALILGNGIEVFVIGWLVSGIGLVLYVKGGGRGLGWGLLALSICLGPLSLFMFAENKKLDSKTGKLQSKRSLLFYLIVASIFFGMGAIGLSAMKDRRIKEEMVNVQHITIAPILAALEKYYQKNGRFPVSTTATTVTPLMSGTLDKGPDVWTSIGLDRYPVFRNTVRGSLVSQLDYTSDASGSIMTLRLTMANFATDSIDGKIISVTPSSEKEKTITWISNCSFKNTYCINPNP